MKESYMESIKMVAYLVTVLLIAGSEAKNERHIVKRSTDKCVCSASINCAPIYQTLPNHTACLSEGSNLKKPVDQMTDALRKQILDFHNDERRNVNPPAANMQKLTWDDELEMIATKWAQSCQNDRTIAIFIPGRILPGFNIGNGHGSFMEVMKNWSDEKKDYEGFYGVPLEKWPADGKTRKDYTQMVWAETSKIGCGSAVCGDVPFYVCTYAAAGNWESVSHPYTRGPRCSMCRKCDDGLCSCDGLMCEVGRLNTSTCSCSCPKDPLFSPPTCTINCTANDYKACGQPKYTDCSLYYVNLACPHMCKYCDCKDKKLAECAGAASLMISVVSIIIELLLGLAGYRLNICATSGCL